MADVADELTHLTRCKLCSHAQVNDLDGLAWRSTSVCCAMPLYQHVVALTAINDGSYKSYFIYVVQIWRIKPDEIKTLRGPVIESHER
jgi:hypothetical protein